jgi:hypothetical protein
LPISPRVLLAILFGLITIVVANNSAGSLAQPAIGEAFGAGTAHDINESLKPMRISIVL